jgi:hypothetical protein
VSDSQPHDHRAHDDEDGGQQEVETSIAAMAVAVNMALGNLKRKSFGNIDKNSANNT